MSSFESAVLAPVTMWGVALGKVLGGVIFGLLVSSVMIPVAVLFFKASLINPGVLVLAILLSSSLFFAFGVFLSLIVKGEVDAMTLANAARLPMIFLSGIFIPLVAFPLGLRVVGLLASPHLWCGTPPLRPLGLGGPNPSAPCHWGYAGGKRLFPLGFPNGAGEEKKKSIRCRGDRPPPHNDGKVR